MPLGGFCETCGRWVWVNGYGECENGHPAAVVRDVQQLRPAREHGPGCARRALPPPDSSAQASALVVALQPLDDLDVHSRPELGRLLLHRSAGAQGGMDRLRPHLPARRRDRDRPHRRRVLLDRARRGRPRPGHVGAAGLPGPAAVPGADVRRRPDRQPAGAAAAPARRRSGRPCRPASTPASPR